ncbi:hypothetical protein M1852_02930 [Lactiplantibacillus plantarum]|nr:hypothetical protein [Lactiplantibacillus plantarum]WHQ51942.1 hypothetical protein M1852_02930 [Lactiplantibacillus plantarum]
MQIDKQQVGNRIHQLRIAAGLSMAKLASAIGLAGKKAQLMTGKRDVR